jgi:hypothetical protein
MKITSYFLLFVLLPSTAFGEISGACDEIRLNVNVPLPQDIDIIAPDKNLPKELAAFSGCWEGRWSNYATETALIVEKIDTGFAKVIYCLGESSALYSMPPSCDRYHAKVLLDKLEIAFPVGETLHYTFSMEKNFNQIKATKKSPLDTIEIIMDKIQ